MQTVTYTNSEGRSVTFGMAPPYLQSHIDGAGELRSELLGGRGAGANGFLDQGAALLPREIAISGAICAQDGRGALYRLRKELARVLNPLLNGFIVYKNDNGTHRIGARPSGLPSYGVRQGDTLPFSARFACPSPWWEDAEETVLALGHEVGGFSFPLRLPARFSMIWPERAALNEGHAETPVRITLSGPAVNPEVINETTGQMLKVERTIPQGGELLINTDALGVSVIIRHPDGTEEDATSWLSLDSTMLRLKTGGNVLKYSTDNEDSKNRLTVAFRRRYAGV